MQAFGIGFCVMGNHATTDAYEWGGSSWCPKHVPPVAEPDPLEPGYCQYGRSHFATDGVRYLPPRQYVNPKTGAVLKRDGRFLCRVHYRAYVLEAIRRGEWRG